MRPNTSGVFFFFSLEILIVIVTIKFSFCNGSSYDGCIASERQALLSFKQDLTDPSNRLASWVGDGDCCKWSGVVCDNFTGHVLQLNLQAPSLDLDSDAEYEDIQRLRLGGKISPSLLNLKHLIHLDLKHNNFEGVIPRQLGNLSNLQYLDLSYNIKLYVRDLTWISNLSLLKHLDLSVVNFNKASDSLLQMNSLPSLVSLQLSGCELQRLPQIQTANFSSLTTLDLSFNEFTSIPSWVFGLCHLDFLDLSVNDFQGPIPNRLTNLTSLKYLDLSVNYLNSSIPNWFSNFRHLEYLSLSFNNLQGRIPKSLERLCSLKSVSISYVNLSQNISEILEIFSSCIASRLEYLELGHSQIVGHLPDHLEQFKNLEYLYLEENSIIGSIPLSLGKLLSIKVLSLASNKLNGTLSQIHFTNLTRLTTFHASENLLTLQVNFDWVPPFQLKELGLSSCRVGPHFPSWLHSQRSLDALDLSNTKISDVIPNWFWTSLSQLTYLNLSHNQIHGEIPHLTHTREIASLDLSSNRLSGPLRPISFDVNALYLSNNTLSGTIYQFLCFKKNESKRTEILNLENNFFLGELPDCWMNWQYLMVLNLGNNKFTGKLPTSLGNLSSLQSLILRKNNLSGATPFVALENCKNLEALDAAENQFVGTLPARIGEKFPRMKILDLRLNKFHGLLPVELCHLAFLQILDLAHNNFFGSIPSCVNNFSAMVTVDDDVTNDITYFSNNAGYFLQREMLVWKGKQYEYYTTLNLVRAIDLSKNNFSGEIPREVASLGSLGSLNLSYNSLTGRIPGNIGDMRSLDSLDFSANQLSGEIPQRISELTFLGYLNLSNNKLTGKIPSSTQLQSFDAASFTGNDLCGPPLAKNCTVTDPVLELENNLNRRKTIKVEWFYVSMALGFVVGFWGVIGPLIVNRRWRYSYCLFLDRLGDKVCRVAIKYFWFLYV